MISVSVTDDVGAARAQAHSSMALYDDLPAFRAVMNREGVRASELAVIGDEAFRWSTGRLAPDYQRAFLGCPCRQAFALAGQTLVSFEDSFVELSDWERLRSTARSFLRSG
jgi:hypothetical protein